MAGPPGASPNMAGPPGAGSSAVAARKAARAAAAAAKKAAEKAAEGAGESLARVLFELPSVSPAVLGSYLSRPEPLPAATLAAMMRRFDFEGRSLDEALRLTFAVLHVPGEAQKVQRDN